MTSNNKIFVFDAYGTLFQVNSEIPGLDEEQARLSDKIQALWRQRQLEYTWLSNSMGRWVDFNQITTEALDFALDYYQVDDENFRQLLLGIYKKPTTFSDVVPFLNYCKIKDIKTAILSNGVRESLQASIEITGIKKFIDKTFSVNAIQVFKPNPTVYGMVTSNFHCEPEDVTFFSSNAWDISGAKCFGFHCIWVKRQDQPFENLGYSPDKVIHALNDYKF